MGCLIEFFLEIVLEVMLEGLICVYIKLMTLIVPNKVITGRTKTCIKTAVTAVAAVLLLALMIGGCLWLADIPFGRPMVLVSLGVIAAQILLGNVVQIITKIQHK